MIIFYLLPNYFSLLTRILTACILSTLKHLMLATIYLPFVSALTAEYNVKKKKHNQKFRNEWLQNDENYRNWLQRIEGEGRFKMPV